MNHNINWPQTGRKENVLSNFITQAQVWEEYQGPLIGPECIRNEVWTRSATLTDMPCSQVTTAGTNARNAFFRWTRLRAQAIKYGSANVGRNGREDNPPSYEMDEKVTCRVAGGHKSRHASSWLVVCDEQRRGETNLVIFASLPC